MRDEMANMGDRESDSGPDGRAEVEAMVDMSPVFQQRVAEYQEINGNIRMLAEIRFKLLSLLPVLGGAAVILLSDSGIKAGGPAPNPYFGVIACGGVLGLIVTLGVTLYDLRNSELYNELVHRAKFIEELLDAPSTYGALNQHYPGGQFRERPPPGRRLFGLLAKHDRALAVIYGPVLGSWFFPITYTAFRLIGTAHGAAAFVALVAAIVAVVVFTWKLVKLDSPRARSADDRAALIALNLEISKHENSGGREALATLMAQGQAAEGPGPILGFRRRTGECVDAKAFLAAVASGGNRQTSVGPVKFHGSDRAVVECVVTAGGVRTHNLRLFVRQPGSRDWKLLGWANE